MELWVGAAMFSALMCTLLLGVPVAFSLLFLAGASLFVLSGGTFSSLDLLVSTAWSSVANFTLTAVPVFILMGTIITHSGIGARLYTALSTVLHGLPGGLAVATTLACTVMAALSGSSVATAAAIGSFAVNEMRRFGYKDSHACGAIAAGGTLGILIPPSIPMIVYGIIAGASIGNLFIAGIIPGLVMASFFSLYQIVQAIYFRRHSPKSASKLRTVSTVQRLLALKEIVPMAILIWIILGSLYAGFATPTEAASLGTVASLLLAGVVYRDLTWAKVVHILQDAAKGSVMVLMILAAAMVFGHVLTSTMVAAAITKTVTTASLEPWALFISINLLLLLLGCFMETLSIIVVTMPILVPIVAAMGWDLIWFGIILTINMELALITPPVGLNLFVVQGVVRDVKLIQIVIGALPYVFIMIGVLALVAVFPILTSALL